MLLFNILRISRGTHLTSVGAFKHGRQRGGAKALCCHLPISHSQHKDSQSSRVKFQSMPVDPAKPFQKKPCSESEEEGDGDLAGAVQELVGPSKDASKANRKRPRELRDEAVPESAYNLPPGNHACFSEFLMTIWCFHANTQI